MKDQVQCIPKGTVWTWILHAIFEGGTGSKRGHAEEKDELDAACRESN